jgi:hypothetical protein
MTECRACQKPMRPKYSTLTEHPGTVSRSARGLCSGCYKRTRLHGEFPEVPEPAHLTRFFERRRRVGIPAEGIQYAGEKN